MNIQFLGAAEQVTGSNYLIDTGKERFLVDFGQFQGTPPIHRQNYDPLPFDPKTIDFVILTHAHVDHCGRLPLLTKAGFTGKIYCTYPTADLATMMLKDSGKIHEEENEWENRKRMRAGLDPVDPLFTAEDAENCSVYFYPVTYNQTVEVNKHISIEFVDAGHLLGSASLKLSLHVHGKPQTIVFSGDLGTGFNPLLNPPTFFESADQVIMESTYALRTHSRVEERGAHLSKIIEEAMAEKGTVIIPSFSLGRTQEVFFILKAYYEAQNRLDVFESIPIYIDSPLAIEATHFYKRHLKYLKPEIANLYTRGLNPLESTNVHYIRDHETSMALNRSSEPKVIISASGMCEAGRIRHHLKHYLWKKETRLVFIGYQGEGTLGRALKEGLPIAKLFNEDIKVNAKIYSLDGFSGHADTIMLTRWFAHIQGVKRVFVTHGEAPQIHEFAAGLKAQFGCETVVPKGLDTFEL